jgi:hypothetical protein
MVLMGFLLHGDRVYGDGKAADHQRPASGINRHASYLYVHAVARYLLTCLLMQDRLDRLCQLPQHHWLHQDSIYQV